MRITDDNKTSDLLKENTKDKRFTKTLCVHFILCQIMEDFSYLQQCKGVDYIYHKIYNTFVFQAKCFQAYF